MAAPARSPDQHTTFRMVTFAASGVAAILFVLTAVAIVRYGDRVRDFGWTATGAGGVLAVGRVDAGGPADGLLQPGDAIVAWNGDRRIVRIGSVWYRRLLFGTDYTLTIRRDGREQPVVLTTSARPDPDEWRLALSCLVAALVWFVVATMIALFRPEQTASRSAYVSGMVMGLFMLSFGRDPAMTWLPQWWWTALLLVFPFIPLHVAIGYDFYARFPPGITITRPWRAIRVVLYVVCGALCLTRAVPETITLIVAPERIFALREVLMPIDRWLLWPRVLLWPVGAAAIVAVLARNYRTVQGADDRRRLRWVLWGTIIGLAPFLVLQTSSIVLRIMGRPFASFGQWLAWVNLATALIPISFGYAVIKHHVFDITFVIRRGLQYLLARNALRVLLALPIIGLVYGVFMNRDQSIGQLLWTNSAYVYLIVAALASLRFRAQLTRWLDRRFFREAYDRQRILVELIEQVETLDSASSVSKLVSHELEAAFHPSCLFVWYREGAKPNLTLSYSSGGYIHAVELAPASPLLQLAERAGGIVELPHPDADGLPSAERAWLAESGVRVIVPMVAAERQMVGLLMLGDKKSEEPYSTDDLKLLQAIARQIAVGRDNVRLKERVDQDRRLRHDVLAHLETGHVNLLKECPVCGRCYDAQSTVCESDGTELTLSLPVERTIEGKYRLDRLIGKGGMGAVYEAADLRLARRVAVKILLGRAFGDRQALRRFEREAQACARLTHPNIITAFDFGAIGADGAFLVMELLHGRTLRTEIRQRGHLSAPVAAIWFEQICAGVAAAHQGQVIHRDLKPENVLMATTATGGEIVKVLDFGLAKMHAAGDDSGGLTHPGAVMGTAGYMAPEQLSGGEADDRTDVFAIGVMATEAITGQRPFRGQGYSELLMSIANNPVSLGGEGADIRHLETVLRRATANDPAGRHASVAALAQDLVPALRALPTAGSDPDELTAIRT
jgi:hypothetical protein